MFWKPCKPGISLRLLENEPIVMLIAARKEGTYPFPVFPTFKVRNAGAAFFPILHFDFFRVLFSSGTNVPELFKIRDSWEGGLSVGHLMGDFNVQFRKKTARSYAIVIDRSIVKVQTPKNF